MFSSISLEERVSPMHPLRQLRKVIDALLASMSAEFEAVYATGGRPANPGWSCDFMSDALCSGRRFRTFTVIDEYNREGLCIEIDTCLWCGSSARRTNGSR